MSKQTKKQRKQYDQRLLTVLRENGWEKEVHQKNEIKDLPRAYTWKREDGDHFIDEREYDYMAKFWEEKINTYNRRTAMKYHDITIHKKNGGFIVNVGCETFVFETEKKMFEAISLYFKDPQKAEEKYVEQYEGE